MARVPASWAILVVSVAAAFPQNPPKQQKPPAQQEQSEQEPPEEDASLKPKEYAFNPLQAQKEMSTGIFYYKKGTFKAAASRFREATRWDPSLADAWFRLGEAEEKLHDKKAAKEAYAKYLEIAPDGKEAAAAKRKVSGNQ